MNSTVISIVRTTDERATFLGELEMVERSLFHADETDLASLSLRKETLAFWLEIVRDKVSAKRTLDELRASLASMPVVRLVLAGEPTYEEIERYVECVRAESTRTPAILDIQTDPQLIAGAQVIVAGRVVDGSLRHKLTRDLLAPHVHTLLEQVGS